MARTIGAAVILAVLCLLMAAPSGAAYRSIGGSFTSNGGPGMACVYFRGVGGAKPKPHGVICGLRNRGSNGEFVAGPSLVVLLTRTGRVRCSAPGEFEVDGNHMVLGGKRCGVRSFDARVSGGMGNRSEPPVGGVPAGTAPVAQVSGRGEGTLLRNGALSCRVLSAADLARQDPTTGQKDVILCSRRGTPPLSDGIVFDNGFAGCGFGINAATGCGSPSLCGIPDIPVCPASSANRDR